MILFLTVIALANWRYFVSSSTISWVAGYGVPQLVPTPKATQEELEATDSRLDAYTLASAQAKHPSLLKMCASEGQ